MTKQTQDALDAAYDVYYAALDNAALEFLDNDAYYAARDAALDAYNHALDAADNAIAAREAYYAANLAAAADRDEVVKV